MQLVAVFDRGVTAQLRECYNFCLGKHAECADFREGVKVGVSSTFYCVVSTLVSTELCMSQISKSETFLVKQKGGEEADFLFLHIMKTSNPYSSLLFVYTLIHTCTREFINVINMCTSTSD